MTTNQITSTITGNISLETGGNYADPLTVTAPGVVTGTVFVENGETVLNYGLLNTGGNNYGLSFAAGGTATNESGGTISGAGTGIEVDGSAGLISNAGMIVGANTDGVVLLAGGSVGNSGTIGGATNGILFLNATGTVDNSGTVYVANGLAPQVTSNNGAAVEFDLVGSVTNEAGGAIIGGGKGVYLRSGGGSVTNLTGGTIEGYQYGVKITGAAGTIDNQGLIKSAADIYKPEGYGVDLDAGGTITNETHGTIAGYGAGIVGGTAAVVAIYNQGTIAGTATANFGPAGYAEGKGIYLGGGGTIDNETGGAISGHTFGVLSFGSLSLTNESGATISSYKFAVNIDGPAGTIDNSGAILTGTFSNGEGVYLSAGGSVTNHAHGTIGGYYAGVYIQSGNATVDNAGTIYGGTYSVRFNGTGHNTLIVHAGAMFTGEVFAATSGTNTLELASGAAGGAIIGLGTEYKNFKTVTIDSGASWDIDGTKTGLSASSIAGFHAGDRLDITNLAFTAGSTATVSGNVLTIRHGTTTLDTIKLPGTFTGHTFNLLSDGSGGTFVEEDGVACYCRSTLILTAKGERAVQDLRIGDLLVTASGAARPIRWIGMRAYDGRFLAGRKDMLPVTIAAGALADNVPRRDLSVSPLHAMFIDDVLIPANALVDGVSVTQADTVAMVEYFHIELDTHDVIVAEGALSETFIDDDSRGMFHNAAEFAQLYPGAPRRPADYCAPIVEDGEALETIRRRIAARSSGARKAA